MTEQHVDEAELQAKWVEERLASAPPLTATQRDRLAALLAPARRAAGRPKAFAPVRMRVVKPDFWQSPKVANLAGRWEAKLVFAGLMSYVEDNGVALDSAALYLGSMPKRTLLRFLNMRRGDSDAQRA